METEKIRKWYQKKRFTIPLGVVGLFTAIGVYGNDPVPVEVKPATSIVEQKAPQTLSVPTEQIVPVQAADESVKEKAEVKSEQTSNKEKVPNSSAPNGTYVNKDGNNIPSPYMAPSKPAGVTAQCRDGSYSSSANRRGTCSHHGGVATWY